MSIEGPGQFSHAYTTEASSSREEGAALPLRQRAGEGRISSLVPWPSGPALPWSQVVTQALDINTDTDYDRATESDIALGCSWAWTSPWLQVASRAARITLFFTTVLSSALLLSAAYKSLRFSPLLLSHFSTNTCASQWHPSD